MNVMKLDSRKKSLSMFYKKWEIEVLNCLWFNIQTPQGSSDIWKYLSKKTAIKIGRASVFQFLEQLTEEKKVIAHPTTGKGGRYYLYTISLSKTKFTEKIVRLFMEKLLMEFPEETKSILNKIQIDILSTF